MFVKFIHIIAYSYGLFSLQYSMGSTSCFVNKVLLKHCQANFFFLLPCSSPCPCPSPFPPPTGNSLLSVSESVKILVFHFPIQLLSHSQFIQDRVWGLADHGESVEEWLSSLSGALFEHGKYLKLILSGGTCGAPTILFVIFCSLENASLPDPHSSLSSYHSAHHTLYTEIFSCLL